MKVQLKPYLRQKKPESKTWYSWTLVSAMWMSMEEREQAVKGAIEDIMTKNGESELDSLYNIVVNWPSNSIEVQNIDTETKKREIQQTISNIISEWDWHLLKAIYEEIYNISWEFIDIEDIDIHNSSEFLKLTRHSQKKVVAKYFKDKFPDKDERKRLLSRVISLEDYADTAQLQLLRVHPAFWFAQDLFWGWENQSISEIIYWIATEMSPEEQNTMLEILTKWWADTWLISRIQKEIWIYEWEHLVSSKATNIEAKSHLSPALPHVKSQLRESNSDFNPMVLELNLGDWLKVFSESRFKEIYQNMFYSISQKILKETEWQEPSFNNLMRLEVKRLKWSEEENDEKKEDKQVYQFLLEWELSEDFDEKDLVNIVDMMRERWYPLNTIWTRKNESLKYPKTKNGLLKYNWHLSETWSSRANDHAIIIEDDQNWIKDLRIWLSDFSQDNYTYIVTQIGHYVKHRHFINKHQLFTDIYKNYNTVCYWKNELFDISIFKKQYDALMRKVVIPHSVEAAELEIKSDNVLLAWLYWTGKSQFLLNLLTQSKYDYEWKEFNLNANVVTIDLMTFKATILNNIWGFRTRLDDIYQNTWVWIILVIEDLDTLVNEKLTWWNDEVAQAMTILFEWIGSIPLTIVTTANDPTKFSERLTRPWRLYEIIEFERPTIKQKHQVLDQHLKNKWIEISDEVVKKLEETVIFEKGTASHIGKFVEELSATIKIREYLGEEKVLLSDDEIISIASSINISTWDIEKTIKNIREWVLTATWKKDTWDPSIWYNAKLS